MPRHVMPLVIEVLGGQKVLLLKKENAAGVFLMFIDARAPVLEPRSPRRH